MKNKHFKGTKDQSLPDMKPVIEKDNSNVNIHLAFITNCGGGQAYRSQICQVHPLAVNCYGPSINPMKMAEIVTHEMGHVLGNIKQIDIFKTLKNMSCSMFNVHIKITNRNETR